MNALINSVKQNIVLEFFGICQIWHILQVGTERKPLDNFDQISQTIFRSNTVKIYSQLSLTVCGNS